MEASLSGLLIHVDSQLVHNLSSILEHVVCCNLVPLIHIRA